jgi:Secretion system C-terminal sorting domain
MKKIYSLLLSTLFTGSLMAQQEIAPKKTQGYFNKAANYCVPFTKKSYTGFEEIPNAKPDVPSSAFARGLSKSIGVTNYDLQTNSTVKSRLINYGGGVLSGAYIFRSATPAASDDGRGSGYNSNASGNFAALPTKRVESVRTGFTNLVADVDGNEYLIAHTTAIAPATGFAIVVSKKLKGATTWTTTRIPTSIPSGQLWSSAAIGGANGKTIHVVAATDQPYKGMTRALPYYRSKDGGVTWDKKDVILPGLDSTRYTGVSADNYNVIAQGDNIAITVFGSFINTETWISKDNGDTWTRKTVREFPLKLYKINDGYDPKKLPKDKNPDKPSTPYAIFTSDESGTTFFDKAGKLHVMFGRMYVNDSITTDAAGVYNYYPSTNSFAHWDESYPKDSLLYVEGWPDINKNDKIDITNTLALYGQAMTTYLTSAVGPDGNIYVAYSSVTEEATTGDDINYHRIYIIASKDNGKTWTDPYPVNNKKYFNPNGNVEIDFAECVFPTLATKVDAKKLHLLYQIDDAVSLQLNAANGGQQADVTDNYFDYVDIDIADLVVSSEEVVVPAAIGFTVSPNPTQGAVELTYDMLKNGDVTIRLMDITGRTIQQVKLNNQTAGKQSYILQSNASAGLYLVQLTVAGQTATQKLVVR